MFAHLTLQRGVSLTERRLPLTQGSSRKYYSKTSSETYIINLQAFCHYHDIFGPYDLFDDYQPLVEGF